MWESIVVVLFDVAMWKRIAEASFTHVVSLLILSLLTVYVFPRSWVLALWRKFSKKYRVLRQLNSPEREGLLTVYNRFDLRNCPKKGNWNIWSIGNDEDVYDPFHSIRYSSGASVFAKHIKSECYHGHLRLNVQCYSESPNKLCFSFTTDKTILPFHLTGNKTSVAIIFGNKMPVYLVVNINKRDQCNWRFSEEDTDFIKSSLLKSDHMLVRWYESEKHDFDGVLPLVESTASFDLTGTKEAFAEIKKRCKGYLHKQFRSS